MLYILVFLYFKFTADLLRILLFLKIGIQTGSGFWRT